MARPVKEGLDYFPHDTDAAGDEKIEALTALFGAEGYAFYFVLLERIYRQPNGELPVSGEVSAAETMQILARKISITKERFAEILPVALRVGLFDQKSYTERGVLTSPGIKSRLQNVQEKRVEERNRYLKKVSGLISAPKTNQETHPETPQGKESKGKESKVDDNPLNPPTPGAKAPFVLPEDIDTEAWTAFEELRSKQKPPLTDYGRKLLIAELRKLRAQGNESTAVINQSVANGYKGFWPLKGAANATNRRNTHGQKDLPSAEDYERAAAEQAHRDAESGDADLSPV